MVTSRGVILILISALSFAVSTVFAKLVTESSATQSSQITFFRFLIGFIGASAYIVWKKQSLRPHRPLYMFLRAVFNATAVLLFYAGVQHSSVTRANMINMTYPVFVFLFAPFINSEKNRPVNYCFLALTLAGVFLISMPGVAGVNRGDLFSLGSALLAGLAISTLREARKYDSTELILFYLMLIGVTINLFIMLPVFIMPRGIILVHTLLSAVTAVAGQVALTVGYRYIDAAPGSLVSSSRIFFAALLGFTIFADQITTRTLAGGILIILSLAGVSGMFGTVNSGEGDGSRKNAV